MRISEDDLQRLTQQVGANIQRIRKAAGWTQEQIERKTNIYDVGLIERGETNPTLLTLMRMAAALEVELIELFRFSKDSSEVEQVRVEIFNLLSRRDLEDHRKALEILKLVFS